ncbi:MAG: UDP-N-acetylmuramate dehydrogenase [Burkholderiaceae bacterium]
MIVKVATDVSLEPYNTFGVTARAAHFATIASADELAALLDQPRYGAMPRLVLGGGSNLLLTRDFDGLVIKLATKGIERLGRSDGVERVRVGAAENWHTTVERLLHDGLPGLENLALIPGEVGAAPIQNIGAYGVELAERFVELDAFDVEQRRVVRFDAAACHFGYRDSAFKHRSRGDLIILSVTLGVPVEWQAVVGYVDVAAELRTRGVDRPAAREVFDAVVAIRRRKLPDPAVIGNAGSFFKNPVVARDVRNSLIEKFPSLVSYDLGGARCKLAAGWLIEACGLKGAVRGCAAVYEKQALVLVNRGGATGAEILALAREVQEKVQERFGIQLEPEPTIV